MNYALTGYVDRRQTTVPISKTCFNAVKRAKVICLTAINLEEKFSLVIDNFLDFELELLRLAQTFVVWPRNNHERSMLERLSLDRRIVNLLTSVRLYSDQSDHEISQLFGNPSVELNHSKSFKRQLYDQYFGYRFMEALRNYVQHMGLPIHELVFETAGDPEKKVMSQQFSVSPKLKTDSLSEAGFKKTVLAELKAKGAEIDLREPTREYIGCITKLHRELRKILASSLSEAKTHYHSSVTEFSRWEGKTFQLPRLVAFSEGQLNETIELPTDFLDYHEALFEKNSIRENIERCFASNRRTEFAGT